MKRNTAKLIFALLAILIVVGISFLLLNSNASEKKMNESGSVNEIDEENSNYIAVNNATVEQIGNSIENALLEKLSS